MKRRAANLLCVGSLCVGAILSGCVTVPEDGALPPRTEANLVEAARINTEIGLDYMRKGQFEAALDKLSRAVVQNPGYALAHSSLAFVHATRGETELAEKHYDRALYLEPGNASTRNNFGIFLCGQKRYKDAIKLFLQAARDPKYTEQHRAWLNAGVCARREPDLERADGYFREALALRPEDPEVLAQLASVSYERRDYLRSRAFLQRYEKVGPSTAQMLYLGASTEAALGDMAAAQRYSARLKLEFPESEESVRISPSTPPS